MIASHEKPNGNQAELLTGSSDLVRLVMNLDRRLNTLERAYSDLEAELSAAAAQPTIDRRGLRPLQPEECAAALHVSTFEFLKRLEREEVPGAYRYRQGIQWDVSAVEFSKYYATQRPERRRSTRS